MAPPIHDIESEIETDFSYLEDWSDRYTFLIELGKGLPPLDDGERTESNRVEGCQSQVWVASRLEDGMVHYQADSDALITKGLISLLVRLLSGQPPRDILATRLEVLDRIGLREHLSPLRANGLQAMIQRMKQDAASFTKLSHPTLS